ncbi:unnamed protein product [Brassica napus]|uniref:(rape) hypothetical protein n=1 Tax=Brassica napus TaxID=3708 RepID=A0A816XDB6_BRANA|nr:unnamed protein product [Brassica napus]
MSATTTLSIQIKPLNCQRAPPLLVFMIDVIVAGTDGVAYDNLYNDEITDVSVRPGLDPKQRQSPFADVAQEAGWLQVLRRKA